jgi:hypothetical protein
MSEKSQSGIGIFSGSQQSQPGVGNLASEFRHQGQSGTAGHGLVQHCPAMVFYKKNIT